MSALSRRMQLLLDEDRYVRLTQRANETGQSVAAVIREAIDMKLAEGDEMARRREAGRRLLSGPFPEGPQPDWEDIKNERFEELARRWGV